MINKKCAAEEIVRSSEIRFILKKISNQTQNSAAAVLLWGEINAHLTSSVAGCAEVLPWPLAHASTIHLTADTGVPLGCSFAFRGIISHLQ